MHSSLKPNSLTFAVGLALAGLALSTAPAHAGGLNGQPVQVTDREPDTSTVFADDGTHTVTSSGVTFVDTQGSFFPSFMTIDVTPSQIVFMPAVSSGSIGFGSVPFNGYAVSEVGSSPADINGVSIDPATSISSPFSGPETFDMSRVTFDSGNVFVNFQGLELTKGDNVTLDVKTAPVPEASTTVSFGLLLALGLGGLIVAARRKKAGMAVQPS